MATRSREQKESQTRTQKETQSKQQKDGMGKMQERTVRMVRSSIDLPEETRRQIISMLNQHLADLFDLFSQTKQAHWNVKGPQFFQLHKLYDDLAEQLLAHVDLVAERVTALGGAATGTARMAAASTRLDEYSEGPIGSMESVQMLVQRYAAAAETVREGISQAEEADDQATMDLLTEVVRDLDKGLWFLEAHLQVGGR
jgi:starvation-inducible DNA-binding protein